MHVLTENKIIMKKIFSILAISIALISCSNEDGIIQGEEVISVSNMTARPSVYTEVYADSIFAEYVNSSVFLVLKTERKSFFPKIKRIEDLEYLETIENDDQFLSWITSNIAYTDFSSIAEAINQRVYIGELKRTEVQNSPLIYDFIVNAPKDLVLIKLEKWLGDNHTPTSMVSCEDQLNSCESSVWGQYIKDVNNAYGMIGNDLHYDLNMADERFERGILRCANYYIDCVDRNG